MSGNEAAAIGSLRAMNSAEASYSSAAGQGGYAILLATLALPCSGGTEGFISPDLALDPSTKSGYTITLGDSTNMPNNVASDCNGTMSRTGYYGTAVPLQVSGTGQRAFRGGKWHDLLRPDRRAPPKRAARRFSNDSTRKTTHEEVPETGTSLFDCSVGAAGSPR
jgi:hypothetical protein